MFFAGKYRCLSCIISLILVCSISGRRIYLRSKLGDTGLSLGGLMLLQFAAEGLTAVCLTFIACFTIDSMPDNQDQVAVFKEAKGELLSKIGMYIMNAVAISNPCYHNETLSAIEVIRRGLRDLQGAIAKPFCLLVLPYSALSARTIDQSWQLPQ